MLEHVSKTFGDECILKDVSLSFEDHGRYCVTGRSGRGKTTLLRLIGGLETPDTGTVAIAPGTRFSWQFQEDRLLPRMKAADQLALTAGGRERALELMEAAGLKDAREKYPAQMSGGMKRRLSLLRALAFDSDVLLLDEPLRELDAETTDLMLSLIGRMLGERTLIMVTHQPEEARALGCAQIGMDG
ncbi:MAG: ATP-binding cassette domain-containing protein [Clostridia bacterium]|nr:ATP-binding cassette domain-containing protein [Clostridia bacterium]